VGAQESPGELRARLEELIDEYRAALHDALNGLTEEEARLRLVPSKTTLLGLLKHVTYVEGIWFDQALTGRSTQKIGIPPSPDRSFVLRREDTIDSCRRRTVGAVPGRARLPRPWPSTTSSPVVVNGWCGRCTCRCCGSWPTTAATPTSSASRCWPAGPGERGW
jgi:hypothetical protein